MIELTKINGELIIVNSRLIEYIVTIPETKLIMTNGRYHIVKEPAKEIVNKVIDFERKATGSILNLNSAQIGNWNDGAGEFRETNLCEEGK